MIEFAPQNLNLRMNIPGNWVPPVLVKVCQEYIPTVNGKSIEDQVELQIVTTGPS